MTTEDWVLVVDQGTTSTRAIVFDSGNRIRASARRSLTPLYPRPGWVEQDPEEIWRTVAECMSEAWAACGADSRRIGAIGIANQRETTLVWDRVTGRPVVQRHCLAGPADRETVRRARRSRPRRRGCAAHRTADRSLFFGHQASLDPRRTAGCAARRARLRHRRQLSAVAPDRRQRPRHRRHERRAHLAVRHPPSRVVRHLARSVRRPAVDSARSPGTRRDRSGCANRGCWGVRSPSPPWPEISTRRSWARGVSPRRR